MNLTKPPIIPTKSYFLAAILFVAISLPTYGEGESVDSAVNRLQKALSAELQNSEGKNPGDEKAKIIRLLQNQAVTTLRSTKDRRPLSNLLEQTSAVECES